MRSSSTFVSGCALLAVAILTGAARADNALLPIKVGIIGLDAHGLPFTKIMNDPNVTGPAADLKIVAAYPAGSPDIPMSMPAVKESIPQMRALGVEIVGSVEELLPKVDVVIVANIDGRPHFANAKLAIAAHKPVFVDKPVGNSLAEVIEFFRLAKEAGVPCFTNSSLRYSAGFAGMRNNPRVGKVLGCDAYCSNERIEPSHPDLYYYGIHGCEILFTIMGPGCRSVTRVHADDADMTVGVWKDGRVGTFRGILKGQNGFGATVFGDRGIATSDKWDGYLPLVLEIAKFFRTGKPPISAEDTIEIYAFMEAADESKRQGGCPVTIQSVLEKVSQTGKVK